MDKNSVRGVMKNFKLYYIEDEYINYLRQFDNKVAYNKNKSRPWSFCSASFFSFGGLLFVPRYTFRCSFTKGSNLSNASLSALNTGREAGYVTKMKGKLRMISC